jgi:hypothetical protein
MTAQWEAYAHRAKVLPWLWKPQYGEKEPEPEVSKELRFELKPGDDLEGARRPDIANRAFSVSVELAAPGRDGVLVAQGGLTHGFSLYFKDGVLHWAIRSEHAIHEITANSGTAAGATKISASLGRDGTLRLGVDGRDLATGKAPGLLPKLPVDGLQVGRDLKGAVGDYTAPFPFQGKIQSAVLVLEE